MDHGWEGYGLNAGSPAQPLSDPLPTRRALGAVHTEHRLRAHRALGAGHAGHWEVRGGGGWVGENVNICVARAGFSLI